MTDKEAIEILKDLRDLKDDEYADDCDKEVREALEKGIESLESQKTEHWIEHTQEYAPDKFQTFWECSECSEVSWLSNYCPNCGAKMVKPQERENNNETN